MPWEKKTIECRLTAIEQPLHRRWDETVAAHNGKVRRGMRSKGCGHSGSRRLKTNRDEDDLRISLLRDFDRLVNPLDHSDIAPT